MRSTRRAGENRAVDLLKFQVGELDNARIQTEKMKSSRRHGVFWPTPKDFNARCGEAYSALYESEDAALARLGTVWKRVAELAEVVRPSTPPRRHARRLRRNSRISRSCSGRIATALMLRLPGCRKLQIAWLCLNDSTEIRLESRRTGGKEDDAGATTEVTAERR